MATSLNKAHMTIRKRLAPNFLAKKVKSEINVDSEKANNELSSQDNCSTIDVTKSENQVLNSDISSCEEVILSDVHKESKDTVTVGISNDKSDCSISPVSMPEKIIVSAITDIVHNSSPFSNSWNDGNSPVASPSVIKNPNKFNVNEFKSLKRRCIPALPKKRPPNIVSTTQTLPEQSIVTPMQKTIENVPDNADTSSVNVADVTPSEKILNENSLESKTDTKPISSTIDCYDQNNLVSGNDKKNVSYPGSSKPLLLKKPLPTIARKRPAPIVPCAKTATEPDDKQSFKTADPNEESEEPSIKQSKLCDISETIINVVASDNSSSEVEQCGIDAPIKSVAISTSQDYDCVSDKDKIISKTPVIGKTEVKKFLKRRIGPKLVNSNTKEVTSVIKDEDNLRLKRNQESKDLRPQSNESTADNMDNQSKVGSTATEGSSTKDSKGVSKIFNIPQHPLNSNAGESDKDSIFTQKEDGAISDLKSIENYNEECLHSKVNIETTLRPPSKFFVNENIEKPAQKMLPESDGSDLLLKQIGKNSSIKKKVKKVCDIFEKNDVKTESSSTLLKISDCKTVDKSDILSESKEGLNTQHKSFNIKSLETEEEIGKDETVGKPYTLRLKKTITGNIDQEGFDDGRVEDIFTNSEDSDASVFTPSPEKKKASRVVKVKRKGKKRGRIKKELKARKIRKPRKKLDIKEDKKLKKMPDNPSAFTKLSLELKNKNKWDEQGNCAEPEKLELKDYIFYVPKNVPMSQESKKEIKLPDQDQNEMEIIKETGEDQEDAHGPKLIVKDGKIIIDPNSTRIKQTPVVHSKIEKYEKPKEPNDPWDLQDTMRFYATLWKYGIDFSMLAGTFPKKSRDSIKKKFNYEEKNNETLMSKTLTKKLDIKAILRELVLIDRLMSVTRKRNCSDKIPKESKNKVRKHCLLPKKKKNKESKISICPLEISNHTDDNSNVSLQSYVSENEIFTSKELNLRDIITFSTNVVYKDMNIVESVSFHPEAIQPIDVNVTIRHDPVTEDTSLK